MRSVNAYGAFYVASDFAGNVNISNAQLIGQLHGLRIKLYNNGTTANVTISDSWVYGDYSAFDVDEGTLTINQGVTTGYRRWEINRSGGTVIDELPPHTRDFSRVRLHNRN